MNLMNFQTLCAAGFVAALAVAPVATHASEGFSLTSPSFSDNDILDRKHAAKGGPRNCDGENISPALDWSNAPEGTKSFAMIVFDAVGAHGQGVTHWVGYGIPGSATSVAEGEISSAPDGANYVGGTNRIKKPFFFGPCPDVGDTAHHYEFMLIATDLAPDALEPGLARAALLSALSDHALGATSLVGRYAR